MSPLWNKCKTKQLITFLKRPSLKQYSDYHIFAHKHIPLFESNYCTIKGISLFISRSRRVEASMTVEAAIVLPLFLFFFLNLSCAIELMRLHSNFQFALTDIGNRMAVYGHAFLEKEQIPEENNEFLEELKDIAVSYTYIRNEIIAYLGREYLKEAPLAEGVSGIQLWESEIFNGQDCVEIIVTYEAAPLSRLVGFGSFRMFNRYYGHAWNGYQIPRREESPEQVYVAENGVVYHEDEECTHLYLSVRKVSMQEAFESRNAHGERYTPCQRCRDSTTKVWVYITEDGDKVHYEENCPGLKRTVYVLSGEQAKKYKPCNRCAQN